MFARRPAIVVVAAIVVGSVLSSGRVHAHGADTSQLPTEVPATTDEAKRAKAVVESLEAEPEREALDRPLDEARRALARGHAAFIAGDSRGARLLGRLALEWADTGRALLRAMKAEAKSQAAQARARDLGTRVERARALLAEAEARRLQLAADVTRAEGEVEAQREAAERAERERVEGRPSGGGR